MESTTHDDTMSLPQAAKRLGVSQQRLSQLARDGALPATNVYGLWRVKEADVQRIERGEAPLDGGEAA